MRLIPKPLLPTAIITLAAVICVSAQDSRSKFEVASVKVMKQFHPPTIQVTGDRFVAMDTTLKGLLQYAYHRATGPLLENEIVGAPGWANMDRFDVEARSDGEVISPEQAQRMMQSLLEDRFQLKAHWETRELPVYSLVVAKQGKLKLSDDQTPPPQERAARTSSREIQTVAVQGVGVYRLQSLERGETNTFNAFVALVIRGRAIPIASLAKSLEEALGYTVTDKTNLNGLFDMQLQFARPGVVPDVGAPPGTREPTSPPLIFTALQEQLGLKLESARGPVDVLVIDSVSRPTEN